MTKKINLFEFKGLKFPPDTFEYSTFKLHVYVEKGLEDIIITEPHLTPNNPTITTRQTKIFVRDDNGEKYIFKIIYQYDANLPTNQSARSIRPGVDWRGLLLVVKYVGERVRHLPSSDEAVAIAATGEFLDWASRAIHDAAGVSPINFPKVINYQHSGMDVDAMLGES